ncbi:glycosyltransferase [Vibrio plantisponsor]|uniref:Glycosyltransferase n=1 Tax=Vibrio plantisponsor TaxID=664643 RepID=A0ABU4IJ48_9VIBR|nr:glycosyltransferase [Vibrio plantisponsor]MDW6018308.1 glycosyltransferase [Vibrio plantisponsor]NNM41887.1 glycosyltransferase [Vibrio plantisponsor]
MKNYIYVESKNQLELAINYFSDYLEDVCIFYIDWNDIIFKWLKKHQDFDKLNIINIVDFIENSFKESLFKGSSVEKIYSCLERYFLFDDVSNSNLVIFNDSSNRGKAVSLYFKSHNSNRTLIQDGWLSFEVEDGYDLYLEDKNYYFGATKPENIIVWGKDMKEKIISRHNINGESIRVVGCEFFVNKNNSVNREVNNIFFSDQCLVDQGKISLEDWELELRKLLINVKNFKVYYKPHPSTTDRIICKIKTIISEFDNVILLDKDSDASIYLEKSDVMLTYYSTYFLKAYSMGIRTIFFESNKIKIRFPKIYDNKISYADEYNLKNILKGCDLKEVVGGKGLEHYIEEFDRESFIYNKILTVSNESIKPNNINFEIDSQLDSNVINESLDNPGFKSVSIYGNDFSFKTGVAKSILTYANVLRNNNLNVNLEIHKLTKDIPAKYYANNDSSEIIIFNSIAVLVRYRSISDLIDLFFEQGRKVFLYCHETEFVFDFEKNNNKAFSGRLEKIKNKVTWLCVSEQQKQYLSNSFGVKNAQVIYETIPNYYDDLFKFSSALDGDSHYIDFPKNVKNKKIVMIGSAQPRKGLRLYDEIASLSKEWQLPYDFYWIGGKTKASKHLDLDKMNFHWLGELDSNTTLKILNKSDMLFVSSIDDPMTLTVIEAVKLKKKVMFYKTVGWNSVFKGYKTVKVFYEYNASRILTELKEMIDSEFKSSDYQKAIDRIAFCSEPRIFSSRINNIISNTSYINAQNINTKNINAQNSHFNTVGDLTFSELVKLTVLRFKLALKFRLKNIWKRVLS